MKPQKLVKSCSECKQICCKHGPGPYKLLTPEAYLENYNTTDAYNTQCAALTKDGRCSVWGTADFPIECRTHVCTNRIFTSIELSTIDCVDERVCEQCGASYTLLFEGANDNEYIVECESCGYEYKWIKEQIKP